MITQICPVCGNSPREAREWRRCPKLEDQSICGSKHCKVCKHWRKEEDKGTLWCTYHHGRAEREKVDVGALKKKIAIKEKIANDLYRRGKWRAAEEITWDIADIQKKIREAEREIHII